MISYIYGVQLTVGVQLTAGFPSRNPGVREGTMSVVIADVPNALRGVRGEVGSTDFYLTAEQVCRELRMTFS